MLQSSDRLSRLTLEVNEKWKDYHYSMPFIDLRLGYQFRVVPPNQGAMMRLLIRYMETGKEYSIYFDATQALGFEPNPYWEVYDIKGGTLRSEDISEIMFRIYEDCEGEDVMRDEYPEYYL